MRAAYQRYLGYKPQQMFAAIDKKGIGLEQKVDFLFEVGLGHLTNPTKGDERPNAEDALNAALYLEQIRRYNEAYESTWQQQARFASIEDAQKSADAFLDTNKQVIDSMCDAALSYFRGKDYSSLLRDLRGLLAQLAIARGATEIKPKEQLSDYGTLIPKKEEIVPKEES